MAGQRFTQQKQQTVSSSNVITQPFDPVPQGSMWSGTIAVVPGIGTDISGATWTVSRNNNPILTWNGIGMAVDVQAASQEVITINGTNLPAGAVLQFIWTGESDDLASAPILWPKIYTSPATDLERVDFGLNIATCENSGLGTNVTLLNDNTGSGFSYRIFSFSLTFSMTLASTQTAKELSARVQTTLGQDVLTVPLTGVPGTTVAASATLPMPSPGALVTNLGLVLANDNVAVTLLRSSAAVTYYLQPN